MKLSLPKLVNLFLTLLALGILIFARVQVSLGFDVPNSNFSFFWLAGRMILDGQNPYDETQYLAGHDANGMDWREQHLPLPPASDIILHSAWILFHANRVCLLADCHTSINCAHNLHLIEALAG